MFSLTANIAIGVFVMAAALTFMVFVNRIWPVHVRYEKEDMIGWQLNMLATTHAVILGFMFYTEWTNFTAVKVNVELEASSLRNVFASPRDCRTRSAVSCSSRRTRTPTPWSRTTGRRWREGKPLSSVT